MIPENPEWTDDANSQRRPKLVEDVRRYPKESNRRRTKVKIKDDWRRLKTAECSLRKPNIIEDC
jgi:hypothetical protein